MYDPHLPDLREAVHRDPPGILELYLPEGSVPALLHGAAARDRDGGIMGCVADRRGCTYTACIGRWCPSYIEDSYVGGQTWPVNYIPERSAYLREFTDEELIAELQRRVKR